MDDDRTEQFRKEAEVMRKNWRESMRALGEVQKENVELKRALAEAQETIETVCVGTAIECTICGRMKPCCCDKG